MRAVLPRFLLGSPTVRRCFVALALILAAAGAARATVVLALDLGELTWRAERIVVGDVVSVRSSWDEGHRRIDTFATVRVVESWKGNVPRDGVVRVRRAGGTVDGITMVVVGEPTFTVGDRAVMFLRGQGTAQVVGMAQGKRTVRRDGAGRWIAEGGAGGADTVAPDAKGHLVPAAPAPSLPLDELRARVRALVGGGR